MTDRGDRETTVHMTSEHVHVRVQSRSSVVFRAINHSDSAPSRMFQHTQFLFPLLFLYKYYYLCIILMHVHGASLHVHIHYVYMYSAMMLTLLPGIATSLPRRVYFP